jgi:hypothetical protein
VFTQDDTIQGLGVYPYRARRAAAASINHSVKNFEHLELVIVNLWAVFDLKRVRRVGAMFSLTLANPVLPEWRGCVRNF